MNEAQKYGVSIIPYQYTGAYWKVDVVRKLTSDQNGGRHNVFVDVYDENGLACRNKSEIRVCWGWEGQRPDEESPSKALDKPYGEPMAILDLFGAAKVWVEICSPGYGSERVVGLTAALPDEGGGATWGHHSYYILFRRTMGDIVAEPDTISGTVTLDVVERIVAQRMQEAISVISADLRKTGISTAKG